MLKAGDNAGTGGDGEELDLNTSDPTDSGEFVMVEQVVGLIIETPLAENNIGTGVLHALNHIGEVVGLHLSELLVLSGVLDLKLVLGLGLWGFEGAGEDAHLGVLDLLLHLGVREVLINDNTFNEFGVLDGTTGLGNDLDEIEVDVSTFDIGNGEHGFEGKVREVVLALGDDLGSEGGSGALSEVRVVIFVDVNLSCDFLNLGNRDFASLVKSVRNFEGVDTLVEELLGLVEDSSSEDDNTGGTVTDLVVLGRGELGKEFGGLVMDLYK